MSSVQLSMFGENMTTAAAKTPISRVEAAVAEHYGLQGEASRLGSERDELFLIDTGDKGRFVLRFANPADDPAVVDMQTHALEWIAHADQGLPVPRLVRSMDGALELQLVVGDNPSRSVRLSSYLKGQPLPAAPRSAQQRRAMGASLAQLGLALRDFSHSGADHSLAWDIKSASCLHELVPIGAGEPNRWNLVRRGLDRFETVVKPALSGLRTQVIHGDFNPHNILVDPRDPCTITGILDFGDMVRTPLVNDLAIACCYHTAEPHPLTGISDIAVAYHRVHPLRDEEIDLLYDLIVTRLCAAVVITEWRARRYPENSAYILKNTAIAWSGLHRLADVEPAQAARFLRDACHSEKSI